MCDHWFYPIIRIYLFSKKWKWVHGIKKDRQQISMWQKAVDKTKFYITFSSHHFLALITAKLMKICESMREILFVFVFLFSSIHIEIVLFHSKDEKSALNYLESASLMWSFFVCCYHEFVCVCTFERPCYFLVTFTNICVSMCVCVYARACMCDAGRLLI